MEYNSTDQSEVHRYLEHMDYKNSYHNNMMMYQVGTEYKKKWEVPMLLISRR
jgi:hypothetical protein